MLQMTRTTRLFVVTRKQTIIKQKRPKATPSTVIGLSAGILGFSNANVSYDKEYGCVSNSIFLFEKPKSNGNRIIKITAIFLLCFTE